MELKNLIEDGRARIAVVGLGYVGLPLAALFAKKGFTVTGIDIRPETVEMVNSGRAPISEDGLDALVEDVVREGRLCATLDGVDAVKASHVVIVVVQTPIHEDKSPDLSVLESALETVSKGLGKGHLVVIESTIPPGTTREVIVPLLEASGLEAGRDFFLAYTPERAIPTRTLREIQTNSRIIGGINRESARLAESLYSRLTTGDIMTGDIPTVEVVKVIENTFRDVNIALANEIALFCEGVGVDALKAIEMANKHPRGVNLHMPGPGVGGHCIPKDPYFLIGKARELGMELRVITAARRLNESMPQHILDKIEESLNSIGKSLEESKVAVLGVAYKGNTDDTRSTPSEEVVRTLMRLSSEVFSHDPLVSQDFGGKFSNDIREAVEGADCVVIMTDHDEYRQMDLKELQKHLKQPCVIVDGRRILDPEEVRDLGLGYTGVGYQ
ncbi:MAG: nucleotide sugar dehydrogenase [Euryarchaeota archaeon]|nr:nucleotide sugar dehydrogenase [Euryarchaeota archaeon]